MAEKIKKTRPELLKQRRALALFTRFLPTLLLKKQQIQMEIQKVRQERIRLRGEIDLRLDGIGSWLGLFSEGVPCLITELVRVVETRYGERNVAGIVLPILESVKYEVAAYSRFSTPPWVDAGVILVKELLERREVLKILDQQEQKLRQELRKITQRVNLFEKVMIPRAQENIRKVRIALAEEQTAGVGRAKIAKGKGQAVSSDMPVLEGTDR
ncbi:MAG: V-type ATP synthase subunit D [Candidatus Ozemobacteraceae bacterium]